MRLNKNILCSFEKKEKLYILQNLNLSRIKKNICNNIQRHNFKKYEFLKKKFGKPHFLLTLYFLNKKS